MNGNSDENYWFMNKHFGATLMGVEQSMKEIAGKAKSLSEDECSEWMEMRELKCLNLHAKCRENSDEGRSLLKEVALVVGLGHKYAYPYNNKMVQHILKELFYEKASAKMSHEEIVKQFKNHKFDTSDYELLIYQQPWYSAFFRCFRP